MQAFFSKSTRTKLREQEAGVKKKKGKKKSLAERRGTVSSRDTKMGGGLFCAAFMPVYIQNRLNLLFESNSNELHI